MTTEVYFNGPLTICSGSQYRYRLENKLKMILGEDRIIGPLDPYIIKGVEAGKIDSGKKDTLLEISKFCDNAYMLPGYDSPSSETVKSWSDVIEEL